MIRRDSDQAAQLVQFLSTFFRKNLKRPSEIVTLADEIEHVNAYLQIEQARFQSRLQVSLSVPDELAYQHLPAFTLQPIVENAIFHGFEADDLNALIEIKIVEKDQNLVIEITDNGRGMEEAKCAEILQHDSTERRGLNRIGIYNVNQRIKLYFGESYGIHIISKMGQFTKVIITMPRITAMGEKIDEKGIDC